MTLFRSTILFILKLKSLWLLPQLLPLWGSMLLPGLYYCPTGDLGPRSNNVETNTSNPEGRHQMWVIITFVQSGPPKGFEGLDN